MNRLLQNWKTTSAGGLMVAGGVVHLVFAVRAKTATEETWMGCVTAIFGGIGLIFAGDASNSQQKPKDP